MKFLLYVSERINSFNSFILSKCMSIMLKTISEKMKKPLYNISFNKRTLRGVLSLKGDKQILLRTDGARMRGENIRRK